MDNQKDSRSQDQAASRAYAVLVTDAQSALFCYICSLLGSARDARDVLQETNLVLLRKSDQYDSKKPFLPWANRIAFFQVLSHRKKTATERLRFSDRVLDKIGAEVDMLVDTVSDRFVALEECVPKLSSLQQEIVQSHYLDGQAIKHIAAREKKSESAISSILHRARRALIQCIEQVLARENLP